MYHHRSRKKTSEIASAITLQDRLRFIECLVSDEVRDLYSRSQDVLDRQQLDARNSENRDPTFLEKMVSQFNDSTYIPISSELPDLHQDFTQPMILRLGDDCLTIEKAKN